jgi:hypothetical protein
MELYFFALQARGGDGCVKNDGLIFNKQTYLLAHLLGGQQHKN